jgi:predicted O-methyltransferase YrrM
MVQSCWRSLFNSVEAYRFMSDLERWSAVDSYLTDLLVRPEPALAEALATSAAAGLPAINVSPPQGKLLQLLLQLQRAKRVLEIGTLGGYSTIWLARGLPKDGHIITLESEALHAKVAGRNIAQASLSQRVEIRLGPAGDSLAALVAEESEPFDFIFIDADKPNYPDYLMWSLKLSRAGTLIVADNIIRDGAVIDADSEDPKVQGVRRFNELVAGDSRLRATALQTVGSKGYDGFTMALVCS